MVYNEQVACLIDMADLGDGKPARNRTQTYKHAWPAMKLTKEDAVTMAIVSEYWTGRSYYKTTQCQYKICTYTMDAPKYCMQKGGYVGVTT
jgi:hypothetical protein